MFNAAGLAVEKIGVNNLDIYIPRINEKYSEDEIKNMFAKMSIGLVSYVDFVATKDPETKEIKFYSAFLRLLEWNQDGYWYNKLIVEKLNKIQISKSEFWMIFLAKTPLSRSKVNTHQLAAYTDELFVKMEAVEKSVTNNMTVSLEHFQNLLAKSEAQAAQIDQLLKIVEAQSKQIGIINDTLFGKQYEEPRKRALTIEDGDLVVIQNVEEPTPQIIPQSETKKLSTYCDDECFFFKPLVVTDTTRRSQVKPNLDIESGSFSFDLEDVLGPVAKSMGISKEEVRNGVKQEFAKSNRARSSSNYCGNA